MKKRVVCLVCVLCCIGLVAACVRNNRGGRGFQGPPVHGLHSYSGEMRQSDLRGGAAAGTAKVFAANGRLRYEMRGSGPLEQLVLLAELGSGKARLLNPARGRYLEGSFTPQHWVYLEYLMEAFPQVMRPRLISHTEERLGTENVAGYATEKIRSIRRESMLDKERVVTRLFWPAEEFCLPLRQEEGAIRRDFTNITIGPLAPSLFEIPPEYRKAVDFIELLK